MLEFFQVAIIPLRIMKDVVVAAPKPPDPLLEAEQLGQCCRLLQRNTFFNEPQKGFITIFGMFPEVPKADQASTSTVNVYFAEVDDDTFIFQNCIGVQNDWPI